MGVGVDAVVGVGCPSRDIDHRAPLGEARAELVVLRQPLAQAVEALGDASRPGSPAAACVPLSTLMPGIAPAGSISLTSGVPSVGVLADGLVVEDDAGDVFASSPRWSGTASRDSRGDCSSVNSTLIASKRFLMVPDEFIGGQDALARRHHGLSDFVETCEISSVPPAAVYSARKIDRNRAVAEINVGRRGRGAPRFEVVIPGRCAASSPRIARFRVPVRSLSSGRALRGPVGTIPECRAESVSWIKPPSGSLRHPGIQLALGVALGHLGRGQHAS